MSDEFKIECKWLGRETGSPIERAFYADIGVSIENEWLTLLEDIEASTVRNHVRACGHQLALWFATNWWRLRWEPERRSSRQDTDWKIAHSMASAGGGYVWPNIFFASEGESLAVASVARLKDSNIEAVRYLNSMFARIDSNMFELKLDAFIEGTLSRMYSTDATDEILANLWSEVKAERSNAEATRWRKLEAMCGYDPDDAPNGMIEMLIKDKWNLGNMGLEEIAAESEHSTLPVVETISKLISANKSGRIGGFPAKLPKLSSKPRHSVDSRPWQRATTLAQHARKEWGLDGGPLTNRQLADLLETTQTAFTGRQTTGTPMPIVLRNEDSNDLNFFFNSSWSTSRRFAASRLLGHCLYHSKEGRLVPATGTKTSVQQFQRAFAQEFLCPYESLLSKIQTTQPEEDDIEEAAKYFEVSPLMVKTTLVNKGKMDREVLNWAA